LQGWLIVRVSVGEPVIGPYIDSSKEESFDVGLMVGELVREDLDGDAIVPQSKVKTIYGYRANNWGPGESGGRHRSSTYLLGLVAFLR
jgi:hypothetical protein